MPRTLGVLLAALAVAVAVISSASAPVMAAPGANTAVPGTPIRAMFIRMPQQGTVPGKPVQVLMALHGMGGNGEAFAADLLEQADRYGWMIVAPTIEFGDWTRPDVVAQEEPVLIAALSDYVDQLETLTGMPVRRQVLLLGHSRGAQLAHRFAEFRPDRVLAVAALSAGTYTLPNFALRFPYGVNDLAAYSGNSFDTQRLGTVQFFVGVGAQDTNPADIPRQWDAFEGNTRLQRAQSFAAAVQQIGGNAVLQVFVGASHGLTPEMRNAACAFLGATTSPSAVSEFGLAPSPVGSY
jgi:pimeloyl-ACP methyl ester carboxylesterase